MKNTRKCKICKVRFTPSFHTMQPTCLKPECLAELGRTEHKKQREKEEKAKKQAWAKEKKERIEKLRTHGEWETILTGLTQDIVRAIDKDVPCISCRATLGYGNPAQSGHHWSVHGYNNLRYNLFNQFVQGSCCNLHKSGNLNEYYEGLKVTYGIDIAEEVRYGIRSKYPFIKLSIPEIKEKINIATQILKELKKMNLSYPPKVRIELRRKYNERIGIYL